MKITVGKHSGFCYGVTNAVENLEKNISSNTFTLGEIIHNSNVVEKYLNMGVRIANEVEDVPNGATVVIRSHGVKKSVIEQLQRKNAQIVDATCPFVKKIQNIVEDHFKKQYQIVVIGKKMHPEVVGINGWCEDSAIIVENEQDVKLVEGHNKLCVVVQTTFAQKKFQKILSLIRENGAKIVEIFNTICYTTMERQKEAEILSKENDAMIVIGGKNSSNTKELFEICKKWCENVFYVNSQSELNLIELKKYKNIGVVAGASTPKGLIKEVTFSMEKNASVSEKQDITMEDVMNQMNKSSKMKKGQRIVATISNITDEGIYITLPGMKADKLVEKDELSQNGEFNKDEFELGDEIEVKIVNVEPLKFSRKALIVNAEEEKKALELIESKSEFKMTFNESNKGGLIGKYGTYSVFVPASQIKIGFVTDVEKYKGKELRLVITECDAEKRKIVASQKVILEKEKALRDEERRVKEDLFWTNIAEGQKVEGKVVRYAEFGAFVNVNGFDCLAHKSDISWSQKVKMEDVLLLNNNYEFVVLKADPNSKKVSLGYKQLQSHPWDSVSAKYPIGSTVKGKIARIVSFGAFVELEDGIDGLVHVSQICHEWIENAETKLKVGEVVEAKVLDVDTQDMRITLSMKALVEAPERPKTERTEAPRTDRAPKSAKPRREKFENNNNGRQDEIRNWTTEESSGASIGDMLKALNMDLNDKK